MQQVETPEEAELVFYNTCSIRDKAEQKVFHRLDQFKRQQNGKTFAVLGCVAQQEGEKIFEKAPHVSMVCGSASYNKLPEMLVQLEAGNRRVTGLSLDTDETFETPMTRRDNPHRAYITIIEGCDKACSYCVVPFTRGPERSRTSASVIEEAESWRATGYTEIQLLGQNVNSYRDPSPAGWDFATLLDQVGRVTGIRRVRFTTSHPRDFVKPIIDAIESNPALCNHVHLAGAVGIDSDAGCHAAALYARPIHAAHRVDEGFAAPDRDHHRYHRGLSRRDRRGFRAHAGPADTKSNTIRSSASSIPGGRTRRRWRWTIRFRKRKRPAGSRRSRKHSARFRFAATRRMWTTEECLVEGFNKATGQWIGRTSQHKTVNFLRPAAEESMMGQYRERASDAGGSELPGRRGCELRRIRWKSK